MHPAPHASADTLPGPAAPGQALPAAILEHRGGPGRDHFDILLAMRPPRGPDDPACATWRAEADPRGLAAGATVRVERIHDHRAAYLALRAARALDGNRGTVTPAWRGLWRGTAGEAIELLSAAGPAIRLATDDPLEWRRIGP